MLAFRTERQDKRYDIVIVDLAALLRSSLYIIEVINGSDPSWAPDGKSLIYGRYCDGIYEFNLDTSQTRQIVETMRKDYCRSDHSPSWSPDGTKLVFVHREFVPHEEELGYAFWVKLIDFDEKKIPYEGEDIKNKKLNDDFITLTSGSSERENEEFRFRWTPDGQKVVFAPEGGTIYVVDVVEEAVVTITAETLGILPQEVGYIYPDSVDLSHDGKSIVFAVRDGLYVVDINGSKLTKIYSGWRSGSYVRWSPDDRFIAFSQEPENIRIISRDGSRLWQIPNTAGWSVPIEW